MLTPHHDRLYTLVLPSQHQHLRLNNSERKLKQYLAALPLRTAVVLGLLTMSSKISRGKRNVESTRMTRCIALRGFSPYPGGGPP